MAMHNISIPGTLNDGPFPKLQHQGVWEEKEFLDIALAAMKALSEDDVFTLIDEGEPYETLQMRLLQYHRNLTEIARCITEIQSRNIIELSPIRGVGS